MKVIVLDVRYYRTDLRSRRKATVLGQEQEEWLWRELDHSRKYTIVGSGTCLTTGGERDKWSAYKYAYKRLKGHLEQVPRLLFVSGDIHRNKFVSHNGFYEVISSGVGRMENRKPLENYGMIDLGLSDVRIELRGRQQRDIRKRIRTSNWREF